MKKHVYSFPMKALAVFLLTLDILLTEAFGAMAVIAYDANFYQISNTVTNYAEAMKYLHENGWMSDYRYSYLTSGGGQSLYEFAFYNRHGALLITGVGLVLFLVLFVYLMAAAGRRGDREGIVLSPMDKIPFDLTLGAGVTVISLLIMIISETSYNIDVGFVVGVIVVCAGFILLTLLYVLYTFSARIKAGGWWRNTVTFMALRLFRKILRTIWGFAVRLMRAIPMAWRVSLAAGAYWLMASIFFSIYSRDEEAALIFFVINLIPAVVVILGAAQMRALHKAARELAAGNLDYKVDTKHLYFDFKRHAENLNSIGDGMSAAVDQRMRSERLKTELITNVSHDIKTPLTSIVNYVDLLQKEHTPQEEAQYLDVLKRQSDKLRRLTVDLVEASKASTGNLPTELVPTNSSELINQAVAEYADRFEAGKLTPIVTLPEKPITVLADGRHLWRVLDNLFNNAVKYAQPGTRIYIDARRMDGGAVISVKNISRDRLNVSEEELMERFVRGDQSRHTEGSGLGLSIARSLTELMGGSFDISIDGDLFKAEIHLRMA